MSFLWPQYFALLLLVPLLPALYVWLLRRRNTHALRYSSLAVVREAAGGAWRRHVPAALLWLACSVLLFAALRPVATLTLPWARSIVMLAIDVSLSMRVTDVKPTRMVAAQEAAKGFVRDLPREIEVGLVTFAGSAQVAQRATADHAAVISAVDAIQMQYGTAIGSAIVVSLSELFPEHGLDVGTLTFGARPAARGRDEKPRPADKSKPPAVPFTPVAPGSYESAAIVLLSDGRRTTGVDTLEAAKMAADRGVRIYVVGLGTVDGATPSDEYMSIYMRLDEPTLREVARMTGGEYHHAGTAEDLRGVYQQLGSRLQVQSREIELTPLLALLGALIVMLAGGLSMAWFGRGR